MSTPQSVNKFLEISKHVVLRTYVNTLAFNDIVFKKLDGERWKHQLPLPGHVEEYNLALIGAYEPTHEGDEIPPLYPLPVNPTRKEREAVIERTLD